MLRRKIAGKVFSRFYPKPYARFKIGQFERNTGIVLMYHEVLPDSIDLPAWTVVRESEFVWQMKFIKSHFRVVPIDRAYSIATVGRPDDKPFAVVTFDDGYSGNLSCVLPIMEDLGLPFTVYVATKGVKEQCLFWFDEIINLLQYDKDINATLFVGRERKLVRIPVAVSQKRRWAALQNLLSQLKTLPASNRLEIVADLVSRYVTFPSKLSMLTAGEVGQLASSSLVTVGAHTHGHELLDEVSNSEGKKSILASCENINSWTRSYPRHFAYPNGNYNHRVIDQIKALRLATSVTTMQGRWGPATSVYEIPRLSVGRFDTRTFFLSQVCG